MARPKGAKGKKSEEQIKKLRKGGVMPLEYMLKTLRNPKAAIELRMDAAKSAAPYCHSRLSAITVDGTVKHSLEECTDEQLKLLRALAQTGLRV